VCKTMDYCDRKWSIQTTYTLEDKLPIDKGVNNTRKLYALK